MNYFEDIFSRIQIKKSANDILIEELNSTEYSKYGDYAMKYGIMFVMSYTEYLIRNDGSIEDLFKLFDEYLIDGGFTNSMITYKDMLITELEEMHRCQNS